MCAPDFLEVDYVINPWMEGNICKANHSTAEKQWRGVQAELQNVANVELIAPQPSAWASLRDFLRR